MIDTSLTACHGQFHHYMCQTLMISAIIYSFEFGLSLRPSSRWSCASWLLRKASQSTSLSTFSNLADSDKFQTLMTIAISAC